MVTNEEGRQLAVAEAMEKEARALAHSTRNVPNPPDSYRLLGELTATVSHLEQVCQQLSAWHRAVVDGVHYAGEDARGDGGTGTVQGAADLDRAAAALHNAVHALASAHSANGVVRWIGD